MIEISVYANQFDWLNKKSSFARRIDCEGVKIPYDSILETMRTLFGSSVIVNFTATL